MNILKIKEMIHKIILKGSNSLENKQKSNEDNETLSKSTSTQLTSPKPVKFFTNLTWSTIDEKIQKIQG